MVVVELHWLGVIVVNVPPCSVAYILHIAAHNLSVLVYVEYSDGIARLESGSVLVERLRIVGVVKTSHDGTRAAFSTEESVYNTYADGVLCCGLPLCRLLFDFILRAGDKHSCHAKHRQQAE